MKKVSKIALFALGVTLIASCGSGPSKKELAATVDSLSVELTQRNSELDEVMGVFNQVSEGFRQINEAENRVNIQSGTLESNTKSGKEQIIADLAFIQEKMKENKEQIAQLQEKLKNSNYNSAQLKKAVESLTAQLEAKTQEITTLQSELASKNIRIKELDETVTTLNTIKEELSSKNSANEETMAAQEKALNAAWYAIGSKKELKEQKILTGTGLFKKGDIMEDDKVNLDYFKQIDIRNTGEIALGSKSAKLLSTHPEGSYSLVENAEGMLTLVIGDPKSFWSVTRYLVVRTK